MTDPNVADTDGDGLLSYAETVARLPRMAGKFPRMDLDANGCTVIEGLLSGAECEVLALFDPALLRMLDDFEHDEFDADALADGVTVEDATYQLLAMDAGLIGLHHQYMEPAIDSGWLAKSRRTKAQFLPLPTTILM